MIANIFLLIDIYFQAVKFCIQVYYSTKKVYCQFMLMEPVCRTENLVLRLVMVFGLTTTILRKEKKNFEVRV